MNVLIVLACVFLGVAGMVFLGERFSKPLTAEQQSKYNKIIPILFLVMIVAALIKVV